MARTKSVHESGFQSAIKVADSQLPKKGSKLREAYDYLFANRGKRVPTNTVLPYMRRDLVDYYGCEIEYKGYKEAEMIFVGEYRGGELIKFEKQE